MGEDYRESSACVVAWDDTALEMQRQNVRPLNGLFWGERQVVRLRWKCTGTPTAVKKHDPMEGKVRDKRGDWHVQCDCIVLVTVRKAEERTQAELEVKSSYMDLFGVDSSQSQSQRSDPPSPPPRRRKKREERHAHTVDYSSEEFPEEDVEDSDNDGGGKRGGGSRGGGEAQEGVLASVEIHNSIVPFLHT